MNNEHTKGSLDKRPTAASCSTQRWGGRPFFISEFCIAPEFTRHDTYSQAALEAIDVLNSIGAQHFRSKIFTDYEQIENIIDSSAALIAIIDQYWTSSTWKYHELLYACGGPSQQTHDKFGPKVPIIAYLTPDAEIAAYISQFQISINRSISDFRNSIINTINEISA